MPLEIQPKEIQFDLSDKEPTTVLKICNKSNEQIAFKVKTTMPKRYLVRPNQDVVDGGETMDVRISLQTKEARVIRQEQSGGDPPSYRDKFLIQSVPLKSEFKELVEQSREDATSAKPMSDILSTMWQQTTKAELASSKLQCTFIFPEPEEGATASQKLSAPSGGDRDIGSEDVVELRKKYSELVNFTVQLTSERDRLKTSYTNANKELERIKQRMKLSGGDKGAGESGAVSTVAQGFPLWQVMLVAVFSFLLARIIGADLA